MKTIRVSGTESRRELAEFLHRRMEGSALVVLDRPAAEGVEAPAGGPSRAESGPGRPAESDRPRVLILEGNTRKGETGEMVLFVSDVIPSRLSPETREAGRDAGVALFEVPDEHRGGLEREVKDTMGAVKVLGFRGPEGRERAYRKALDQALIYAGGMDLEKELPAEVVEAVRAAAPDNMMSCAKAQALAVEMGVGMGVMGRALDLLEIKITECQLGCF